MVRLASALALALCSSACTVVADVDYRRGDGNEAGDFAFTGTVNFHTEYYLDPAAAYAGELDVDLGVDLPLQIAFRTNEDRWTIDEQNGICEYGTVSAAQSTDPGLGRRLAQMVGATGLLCVQDFESGDSLVVGPSRVGTVPPGQEEYLPDEYYFQLFIEGAIPNLYNGTDAQPALSGSAPLHAATFGHTIDQSGLPLTSVQGNLTASIELLD